MYNRSAISRLVMYIEGLNGIGDKNKLAEAVKNEFNLIQDRKGLLLRRFCYKIQ